MVETLASSRQKVLEEVIKVTLRQEDQGRMKDGNIKLRIRALKGEGSTPFAVWALDSGLEYEHAIQRLLRAGKGANACRFPPIESSDLFACAAHIRPQGADGYSLTALGMEVCGDQNTAYCIRSCA
jgi:hypothetical protein